MNQFLRRSWLIAAVALAVGGCGEDDIHVYRVAKEAVSETVGQGPNFSAGSAPMVQGGPPAMPAAPGHTGSMDSMAPGDNVGQPPEIRWRVPKGWKAKPASGMRLASFEVPGKKGASADMSVAAFPGDAGGIVGNINRWRGQVGLEPWDDATVKRKTKRIKSKAGDVWTADFSGVEPGSEPPRKVRMLGAILPAAGKTWFFKLMGDESIVAAAKPSFIEFLKSLSHGASKT